MQARDLWGVQLHTKRGPAGLVSWLWGKPVQVPDVPGAAVQRAIFVSRRTCRDWCREVNADLKANGSGPYCRVSPVRVRMTLEVIE